VIMPATHPILIQRQPVTAIPTAGQAYRGHDWKFDKARCGG